MFGSRGSCALLHCTDSIFLYVTQLIITVWLPAGSSLHCLCGFQLYNTTWGSGGRALSSWWANDSQQVSSARERQCSSVWFTLWPTASAGGHPRIHFQSHCLRLTPCLHLSPHTSHYTSWNSLYSVDLTLTSLFYNIWSTCRFCHIWQWSPIVCVCVLINKMSYILFFLYWRVYFSFRTLPTVKINDITGGEWCGNWFLWKPITKKMKLF